MEAKNEKKIPRKYLIPAIAVAALLIGAAVYFLILPAVFFSGHSPKNVKITESGVHELTVQWDGVPMADGYTVVCSNQKTGDISFTVKGSECKTELTGLLPETEYSVTVTAARKFPSLQSKSSEAVKGKTATPDPGTVTDLSVALTDTFTAKIAWKAPEEKLQNADGTDAAITYTLYRSENGGDYAEISTSSENSYTDDTLKELCGYRYKVTATANVDGKDYLAKEGKEAEILTLYKEVKGVQTSAGTDSITLTWEALSYPEGALNEGETAETVYTVLTSDTADGTYSALTENLTENTYAHTGLAEGTEHFYKVLAKTVVGSMTMETKEADATPVSAKTNTTQVTAQASSSNTSGYVDTAAQDKYNQALAVAQSIAASVTGATDLEKISQAAYIVYCYSLQGTYTTSGEDYCTAYGVFIKGEYSCAGTARAMGMVLDCMGYSWYHVNENQWTHQWCSVTMDGKEGWADAMVGLAGYGTYPFY